MQRIIFEFDDLNPHPEVNCLPTIEKLIARYPNIVLNFFTIPIYKGVSLASDPIWCNRIRQLIELGNVNLAVHSTYHTTEEFKFLDYNTAIDKLVLSQSVFDEANLSFTKVFKGSHWGICSKSIEAMINLDYTHLYSHVSYKELNDKYKDKIKIVYYNYNLKDTWPYLENKLLDKNVIVCHGHTSPYEHLSCGNGITQCYEKLCNIIECGENIEFLKVQDY